MADDQWKQQLERFFYDRAVTIEGIPTLADHCVVSAKDARIATQPAFHQEMVASITSQLALDDQSRVLEVGCASGYIACGLAPVVGHYDGVDLASTPLIVARKMKLENAVFHQGDGAKLAFADDSFDAALAYDVFSNFPSFKDASELLAEMVRVVRPGGRVLAGSITDASKAEEFQQHVYDVAAKLELEYGPPVLPSPPQPKGWLDRLKNRLSNIPPPPPIDAQIINYNFHKKDFRKFAKDHKLRVDINEIHKLNPYYGFRYNVVLTKPE